MRRLTIYVLVLSLVCPQAIFSQAWARPDWTKPNIFSFAPYEKSELPGTRTMTGEPHYYRLIGVDPNAQDLKAQISSAGQKLPEILNERSIPNLDIKMNSSDGRRSLIRELQQAVLLLEEASNISMSRELSDLIEKEKRQLRQKYPQMGRLEVSQRAQILAMKNLAEKYRPQYAAKALGLYQKGVKVLSTEKTRLDYDVRNGIREFKARGGIINHTLQGHKYDFVKVRDADGKWIKHKIPREELTKIKPSEIIEKLKSGGVTSLTMSAATLAFLSLMHSLSYIKLTTSYAVNPMVVEESFNQYFNALFLTSFVTFFASGYGASGGAKLWNRSLNHLRNVIAEKKAFTNKPKALTKARAQAMFGLSVGAMAFGSFMHFGYLQGGLKVSACLDLFNEKPMSQVEKDQKEKLCDTSWLDYAWNLKGEAVKHVGIITFMWWLLTKASAKVIEREAGIIGLQAVKEWRLIAQGGKVIKVLGFLGGVTVFTIGSLLLQEFIEWGTTHYNIHQNLVDEKNHLLGELDALDKRKWQIDPNHCEGDLCGVDRIYNYFDKYSKANKQYQDYLMGDFNTSVENWVNYFGEPLNVYRAGKVFYTDIAEQVGLRREMPTPFSMSSATNNLFNLDNWSNFMNERLPLFRSSPLFGVKESKNFVFQFPKWMNWTQWLNAPNDILGNEYQKRSQWLREDFATKMEEELNELINSHIRNRRGLDEKVARRIIERLKSQYIQRQAFGIYELSLKDYSAQKTLCNDPHSNKGECFLYNQYLKLSSPDIFGDRRFPFLGGYDMQRDDDSSSKTFGAKPLLPGYEFLLQYGEKRLSSFGVEINWHDENYLDTRMNSITEYLLYTSVCGPEPRNSLTQPAKGWRYKFTPPALPFKAGFKRESVCGYIKGKNAAHLSFMPFFQIPNPREGRKFYNGFIDLLYNELDPSVASREGMQQWWDQNITLRIQALVQSNDDKFTEEMVDGEFNEVMFDDSGTRSWSFVGSKLPNGFLKSFQQDLDLHFERVFEPLYSQLEMDFSTFENKQPPKGFDKMEYLAKIKNQLYESIDNFAQLKGNTDIEHVFLAMKEAQKSFLDLLIIFRANEYSMTESIKQLTLDSIINSIESNGKQFASEEEFNKHMDETRSSITEHVCGDNLKDIPRVIFSDLVPRVDRDGQPIINECGNPSLDSAQKALLVNVGFLLFSKIETLSTLMLSANVLKKTQREL